MSDRITIRTGKLAKKLAAACRRLKLTPSQFVRRAVAKELGEPEPEMRPGNPGKGKR